MGSSGNKRALGMLILFLGVFGGAGMILGIVTQQVFLIVAGAIALIVAVLLQGRVRAAFKHDLGELAREAIGPDAPLPSEEEQVEMAQRALEAIKRSDHGEDFVGAYQYLCREWARERR